MRRRCLSNTRTVPRVTYVVVLPQRSDNPKLLIVLRADSEVPYQYIDAVTKELQEASAVRVTFYTNVERRMLRQRR